MTKKDFLAFYETLPEQQFELARKWISELFFMEKSLKKLHKIITEEGTIITKTNGNGFTVKEENPALKSYNTMIRNYNATLKHLVDLRPEGSTTEDDFTEFIGRRSKL